MARARTRKDPVVLSYLALRKAVGAIALALPFALAVPWWILRKHAIETSISGYYHTGMRNLFVGSLCAIAMFMLSCRGYDLGDEVAGIFSAFCAIGVAFFPTTPDVGATAHQKQIGTVHWVFAALLFLTLAYFCLVLFKKSAGSQTPQKIQRNRVYTICGYAILASIALVALVAPRHKYLFGGALGTEFCFETTALLAFGTAWLTKGETFLKDENPQVIVDKTTDRVLMPARRAGG